MVDICVLLMSVRFFLVVSVIGLMLVVVNVVCVGVCMLFICMLFLFSRVSVMCVSGVRLFDVFIEFLDGMYGMMLVFSSVSSVLIMIWCMFE